MHICISVCVYTYIYIYIYISCSAIHTSACVPLTSEAGCCRGTLRVVLFGSLGGSWYSNLVCVGVCVYTV